MEEKRILLVGGGSGGHAYPLIAVARELKQQATQNNISLKLMMLGDGSFIRRAAQDDGIPFRQISAGKLRRYFSILTVIDIIKIPLSVIQSLFYIFLFMPDAVFSKGGYDSFGPVLVARLYFIPVYVHESDSVPGLANSILGRMAKMVFVSFKTAEKYFEGKTVVFAGNPVRKSLIQGNKDEARRFFELSEPRPTILVLGGSQGAKLINDVVLSSVIVMVEKFNVIHQCGENQYQAVKTTLNTILKESTTLYSEPVGKYYRFDPFLNEHQLAMAYSLSDIVISRGGAGALFEIAQLGKPAIIIPIAQSSANHQYLNAFEFSLYGAAMIEEKGFNRESMMRELNHILNPENYMRISEKIRFFATPDAAQKIAAVLLGLQKI